MKNTLQSLFVSSVLALSPALAEESEALHWHVELAPVAADNTVEVIMVAEIDGHSLIYSSDFKSDIGPQPSTVDFAASEGIAVLGPVISVKPKRKRDRTWAIELGYFETRAEFRQKLKILRQDYAVRATIAGQLCNERDGTCTLFTHTFSPTLGKITVRK